MFSATTDLCRRTTRRFPPEPPPLSMPGEAAGEHSVTFGARSSPTRGLVCWFSSTSSVPVWSANLKKAIRRTWIPRPRPMRSPATGTSLSGLRPLTSQNPDGRRSIQPSRPAAARLLRSEALAPAATADAIARNRDVIVGIKTAHFAKPGWTAIDRAVEAGRRAHVPVMVDDKIFTNTQRTTREKLLDHLRPGDIHTHMFNDRQIELIDRFTGKVEPWMLQARSRGVLFDVGHGGGSFLWPVASRAIDQGFLPDTISTDLHSGSIFIQQSDMPNVMSKMMLLGMSLQDVIRRRSII